MGRKSVKAVEGKHIAYPPMIYFWADKYRYNPGWKSYIVMPERHWYSDFDERIMRGSHYNKRENLVDEGFGSRTYSHYMIDTMSGYRYAYYYRNSQAWKEFYNSLDDWLKYRYVRASGWEEQAIKDRFDSWLENKARKKLNLKGDYPRLIKRY